MELKGNSFVTSDKFTPFRDASLYYHLPWVDTHGNLHSPPSGMSFAYESSFRPKLACEGEHNDSELE